jgi:hypothetical protein
MALDPYETAIDQILEGADGDVRLALRTVLMQNVELEARLHAALSGKIATENDTNSARRRSVN